MLGKIIASLGVSGSGAGFRRYFFNTSWLAGGQMISLLISFFIGALVARNLGPGQYGLFSYSLSFAGLFSLLAGLGIDGIIARDLVKTPEKTSELLGSGLVIKIISGLAAWFSASLVAWFFIPSGEGRILVSLIAFSYVIGAFNIIDTLFRARVESKYSVQAQVTAILASSILKIIFILSEASLTWLALIYVLESLVLAAALAAAYWRRKLSIGKWPVSRTLVRKLLASSWPLLLSGLSTFMLLKIDQVMLGSYLNEVAIGLYAAAAKLSEAWYFIPGVICSSLFPAIINAKQTDSQLYNKRINRLYGLLLVLAVLIALVLSGGANFLVNWLFGESFLGAAPVASIYAWSIIGWFLAAGLWHQLMAENRLKLLIWSSVLPLAANVALNLILIPRSGIIGAAWATVISYSMIIILIIYSRLNEGPFSHN